MYVQNALRVPIQNVPVYAGNTRTCFSARARVAGTHGGALNLHTEGQGAEVIVSSAYQEKPTYGYRASFVWLSGFRDNHRNPWTLHVFSSRIDREQHVPDSSNHTLYLTKLFSFSCPGETLEGTSREMVRFVFRSHEKSITNDLHVSIS